MTLGPDSTLGEAWKLIEAHQDDGLPCPLCGQWVQVYRRNLNWSMAWLAIKLYRWNLEHPGEYVHVLTFISAAKAFAGDYSKARFWGLIEAEEGMRPDGSTRVGYWRITQTGIDWVTGKIRLPRYVRVYDNQALGPPVAYSKSGKQRSLVSIRDALGTRFDYDLLMAGEA